MGQVHTPPNRAVETDAATCNLVRHIVRDIRNLEHEAYNLREAENGGQAQHDTAASFQIGRAHV